MAPSQLKQLKTSLRDSGVVGPPQSKKQKKKNAKSGASTQNKIQRNNALQEIRDRFNPFEVKGSKAPKFDVATRPTPGANEPRFRPGVTKGLGEERVSIPKPIFSNNICSPYSCSGGKHYLKRFIVEIALAGSTIDVLVKMTRL